jgi:hypothetical protein
MITNLYTVIAEEIVSYLQASTGSRLQAERYLFTLAGMHAVSTITALTTMGGVLVQEGCGTISRFGSSSLTVSPQNGEVYAAVPCISPNCEFKYGLDEDHCDLTIHKAAFRSCSKTLTLKVYQLIVSTAG